MAITPMQFDVAIVGGGLVGSSLAAALRTTALRVALIEAHAPDSTAQPSFDERSTALGNASRRIFEALGVWRALQPAAAAITDIHVSDAGRFGFARLAASQFGVEALGYVVPNRVLGQELWRIVQASSSLTCYLPARLKSLQRQSDGIELTIDHAGKPAEIFARLVVAADGAQSIVRAAAGIGAETTDYDQVAIVAGVKTDRRNDGVAYERFTSAGPMALLPLRHAASDQWRTLVWAARPDTAAQLLESTAPEFLQRWQTAFGWRAGRALELGQRARYPLVLSRSTATVAPRMVLMGNAAQSLHPVAGQGFNLGLRDAADLAETLVATQGDVGEPQVLAEYEARRRQDRDGVIAFTDSLVRVFSSQRPLVAPARDAALLLFDLLPPAKRALSRVSLGFGSRAPRLARGLPLQP
jgi:2-octaprenyl-6-methoxyphenol hydroxylase